MTYILIAILLVILVATITVKRRLHSIDKYISAQKRMFDYYKKK